MELSGAHFQHDSLFDKSYDIEPLQKINPYLDNMPGTWSAPYKNEKPSMNAKDTSKKWNDDNKEPSPICEWSSTWGDNTVSVCNPPFDFAPKFVCPMSRPLEPQRNIDPDLWFVNKEKYKYKYSSNKYLYLKVFLILLTIIFIYLISK
jgi:hypothetical protein